MSDNGSAFFHANKPNRNDAFSFPNGLCENPTELAEVNGDQSSRLHPTPAVLGQEQKVHPYPAQHEPAPILNPIEQARTLPDGY